MVSCCTLLLITLVVFDLTIRGQGNTTPCEACYETKNGSAIVCPKGYFSVDCKTKCPDQTYGAGCKQNCNCTETQICHNADGCIKNVSEDIKDTQSENPETSDKEWESPAFGVCLSVLLLLLIIITLKTVKKTRCANPGTRITATQERVEPDPQNIAIELESSNNIYEEVNDLEYDYSTFIRNSGVYNDLSFSKCILKDTKMIGGHYSSMASIRKVRTQEEGASVYDVDETRIRKCNTDKHPSDGDDIVMEIQCHSG